MFWSKEDEEEYQASKEQEEAMDELNNSIIATDAMRKKNKALSFPSSDETGSEDRFKKRLDVFRQDNKPIFKHHIWWLIHNCVVHPLIGFFPCKTTFDWHDYTSKRINGD